MTIISAVCPCGDSGGSTNIPVAGAGAVIDSTTYDDTVTGTGKLNTIVMPIDDVAIAFALQGDAFPRLLILSDPTDGIYMADGTVDAYTHGSNIYCLQSNNNFALTLGTPDVTQRVGANEVNRGKTLQLLGQSNTFITFDDGNNSGITSGQGIPNIGANINDLYIDRLSDGTPLTWLYRCTASGVSGVATWVGVL